MVDPNPIAGKAILGEDSDQQEVAVAGKIVQVEKLDTGKSGHGGEDRVERRAGHALGRRSYQNCDSKAQVYRS